MKSSITHFVLTSLLVLGLAWGAWQGSNPWQASAAPSTGLASPAARTLPLIIDHTTKDLTTIPQQWIEAANNNLHIFYGHTSHGSQLTSGMAGLVGFANGGGLGLSLPTDIFAHLDIEETSPDAGYYPTWVERTVSHLGPVDPVTGRGTAHPDTNVVIWAWCGQLSGMSEQTLISNYLTPMSQLEATYPGIIFVYMTGHSDGSGESGNLHQRNQQIRQYAINNNKVLYDFYDIELYDPDNNYYGNKAVNDECWYDSDGNGSRDKNWCTDWQAHHTQNVDWYSLGCAHSNSINCNQKAYAAWWLWASLAGWNAPADLTASSKTVSPARIETGAMVTYTVSIVSDNTLTQTVHLTDILPAGLSYVPGSLATSSGSVDDSDAPTLRWSGDLDPTPSVTITYAATVTAAGTAFITNEAVIEVEGQPSIFRTAVVVANGYHIYLPLAAR